MAPKLTDAFSRWTYEKQADGTVLVTDPDGETGVFRVDGSWVEGSIRTANPQIISFIAGPHAHRDPSRPDPGTRFARGTEKSD